MNIIEIILAPFVFIIKQLFLYSYQLSHNYGIAIIFLSFAISLMLLPIFIFIEKAKKKDDAIKLKMKPLLDEIKRCYKGQERYYYLKTLNRQYNYSPTRALIPILSLLIQIPFFIAAYQFLENYEPLAGVSFLFINDLKAPDALFGAINILPIAMTAVNLLTAYFYTKNGDPSERKQMLVVAGIFLVLLFQLPAGLVLYWTMNNVFSFFRLFITNPEVFKKKEKRKESKNESFAEFKAKIVSLVPKLKTTFYVLLILGVLSQLNWAFQHSFNDIILRLSITIVGCYLIILLLGISTVLYKITFNKKASSIKEYFIMLWPTFKNTFILIATLAILAQLNWALQFNFDSIILRIILSILAAALLTIILALITLVYKGYISIYTGSFNYKYAQLHKKYKIAFWVILIGAISSQINWALQFYFDDIIIRLSFAVALCWGIIVFIANTHKAIKNLTLLILLSLKAKTKQIKPKLFVINGIITFLAIASQINWAIQFNFDDIVLRLLIAILGAPILTGFAIVVLVLIDIIKTNIPKIKIKPWIFYSLLFLTTYFYLTSQYYYSDINTTFNNISLALLIPTQLIGLLNFNRNFLKFQKTIAALASFALLIILILQIINISGFINGKNINLHLFNLQLESSNCKIENIIQPGLIFTLITTPFYLAKQKLNLEVTRKSYLTIYLLSIFYIVGFIFLWNPLEIYSTYPTNFDFTGIEILKHNVKLFALSIASLFLLFILLPQKGKYILTIIVIGLLIMSFIHNTIIPIKMGSLQETKFLNQENLAQPTFLYIIESIAFILVIFSVIILLKKINIQYLIVALILINLILISNSLISSSKTGYFLSKPQVLNAKSGSISFSKDKQNIIYIISDMFNGWYMKKILEENPDIKNELKGFTWYPNTLSISLVTGTSMGPLMGGFDYTIDKLNKDENKTIGEAITEASEEFYNKVRSKDFSLTSTRMIYSTIDKNLFDTYLPSWNDSWNKWNSKLHIGVPKEIGYSLLWENALFYSAPLFLKAAIYNEGKWMHQNVVTNENTNSAKRYNFLRLLPHISNTDSEKSSFINIYSMASHHPWDVIDENGVMHNDVTAYENNKWIIETLAKWMNWMKQNGVYNNTKIVIVSDHGIHWQHYPDGWEKDNFPIIENPKLKMDMELVKGMYPLLLVKDFNNTDTIQEDWSFMSNADAPAILFNEFDSTAFNNNRTIRSSMVFWKTYIWLEKKLNIVYQFDATNSAYDMTKWKRIK